MSLKYSIDVLLLRGFPSKFDFFFLKSDYIHRLDSSQTKGLQTLTLQCVHSRNCLSSGKKKRQRLYYWIRPRTLLSDLQRVFTIWQHLLWKMVLAYLLLDTCILSFCFIIHIQSILFWRAFNEQKKKDRSLLLRRTNGESSVSMNSILASLEVCWFFFPSLEIVKVLVSEDVNKSIIMH